MKFEPNEQLTKYLEENNLSFNVDLQKIVNNKTQLPLPFEINPLSNMIQSDTEISKVIIDECEIYFIKQIEDSIIEFNITEFFDINDGQIKPVKNIFNNTIKDKDIYPLMDTEISKVIGKAKLSIDDNDNLSIKLLFSPRSYKNIYETRYYLEDLTTRHFDSILEGNSNTGDIYLVSLNYKS